MFGQKPQLQDCHTTLSMSYMEIYKDEVYDLLVTRDNVRCISHDPDA